MSALHLVRIGVDARRLYAFAKHARLPARDFDEGYAVHALFSALFDNGAKDGERVAPKPFVVRERGRMLEVLGYSSLPGPQLIERERAFSDPRAREQGGLVEVASRPMPESFPRGLRLGFSVRLCPVRRVAKRGHQQRDRAEVDAFLARAWEVGEDIELDREEVYRAWLRDELEKEDAARLIEGNMTRFTLARSHRRTSGEQRAGKRISHPDATFEGTLEVHDPAVFAARLARGLGRHRAFGFGMLLLRPVRASG